MRIFLLLGLTLLLAGCPPRVHQQALKSSSQLVVRGEATIKAAPDQVEMSLEAATTAETAEEALQTNNSAIDNLRQMLEAEGLSSSEYKTGQFSIQPQWSRPPRPAPANWTPEIVGYRVNNSLQVATSRVELAGRLLALAQQAGVNKAGSLNFTLADPEEANRLAIAAATQRAQLRAETLAQAAGVKLGKLLEARVEESGSSRQPRVMMAEASMATKSAVNNVPISAGDVSVTAAVVLSYEILEEAR